MYGPRDPESTWTFKNIDLNPSFSNFYLHDLEIVVFFSLGFLTKMELIMPTLKVLVKLREGCCKGVWVPDTVAIVSRGTKSRRHRLC